MTAPDAGVDLVVVPTGGLTPELAAAIDPRLTDDERVRRDRYVREQDRHAYVIARALVRMVLSQHGPTAPAEWRFEVNAHGCPFVVDAQAGAPRLCFNVSHTDGLVALAVARGHRVGVDVEDVRRVVRHDVAGHHFAPSEVADLRALPTGAQPRGFFEYWTLKEAYIKARGMGLAIPLHDFAFVLRPPAAPAIAFVDGFDDDASRWQFWQAWPTPDHRLGLAIERVGRDLAVRLRTLAPEALVP
ncbi:MAG: 4'-phosphopantetheinyl transferase superfamily protein [Vicinamibacterales bacterium]